MNISNDNPAVNYVDYFTKQFPVDLATMAALRDELAIRQGALSAAIETNRLLEETKEITENAKAEAAQLVAEAKNANSEAKAAKAVQDAREQELNVLIEQNTAKFAKLAADYSAREEAVLVRENNAMKRKIKLDADFVEFAKDKDALAVRIKVFQDKVAALSA